MLPLKIFSLSPLDLTTFIFSAEYCKKVSCRWYLRRGDLRHALYKQQHEQVKQTTTVTMKKMKIETPIAIKVPLKEKIYITEISSNVLKAQYHFTIQQAKSRWHNFALV